MLREVKAKFVHGKIEPLEELDLKEGDEITIVITGAASSRPKLLFGMLPGIVIKGDIMSPLEDVKWDALN